jgi:signal transduction histidine kinase
MGNLFVSKNAYTSTTFSTFERYKKAVLLGQLCFVVTLICFAYVILDATFGRFESTIYYLLTALVSFVALYINWKGKFNLASTLFLTTVIFLLYVFTDNDLNKLGTHMFLVVYALISITLYGYEQIARSVFFVLVAITCFYASYFLELPAIITPKPFSEELKQFYFTANFLIVLSLSTLLVFFLITINYKAQKAIWLKSQQLIKANNELDRFVYSASHDLKAPLNSIAGIVELSKTSNNLDEVKGYLDLISKSISNLSTFIHDSIDFSRNTNTELKFENLNLLIFIKEIVDSLRFSGGFEKVKITLAIPPDRSITTDASRLKIILTNVISNALKYHNPQAALPWVNIACAIDSSNVTIEIEDNGLGIAKEDIPKIFDMFYRAPSNVKGSGLGLYIVKEAVEKLNGKVSLSSILGKGSSFKIVLPIPVVP